MSDEPIHTLPYALHQAKITHYGEAGTLPNHLDITIGVPGDKKYAKILQFDGQRLDEPIELDRLINIGLEPIFETTKPKHLVLRGSEVEFFSAIVKLAHAEHFLGPDGGEEEGEKEGKEVPATVEVRWGRGGEQKFDNVTVHFKPSQA
ncbi:hypothetical protein TWF718_011037 [Orbilia javanica]|uniref:Uncharacterized protein n=1 Tax=Orbilia javanica TaxID=47235 RepID=A0AAN8MV88_9PEZI